MLPPGSFLPCVATVLAAMVSHAEILLCCSLPQRTGEEGCSAREHRSPPRALILSLYCPVVCFKALNSCSCLLARGVGLLLLYRGCRSLAGGVLLGSGGFRNWCGDLECRGRSPGTAELPWGQQSSPGHAPLGAAAVRSLVLPPLTAFNSVLSV